MLKSTYLFEQPKKNKMGEDGVPPRCEFIDGLCHTFVVSSVLETNIAWYTPCIDDKSCYIQT